MQEKSDILISSDDPTAYQFVTDDDTLAGLCREWRDQQYLALDTEFIRTNTFYPKVGLVQVCDESSNYLVDPLAISDWEPFKALMVEPGLVKILHSCSEDLLVFQSFLGVLPEPIFDTQLASAFLNHGLALSYQNLIMKELGIDLPKGETRSDWLQRPLSDEQLKYAALDVAYLPEIYRLQKVMLGQEGKLAWFREDCERLARPHDMEVTRDFSDYYLGIKGAWALDRRQLAVLRELARWREQRARKRDRPRNWIVRDQQLIGIAQSWPRNKEELAAVPEINAKFVKYEGDAVLRILERCRRLEESELPDAMPRPLTVSQKKKLKAAQSVVQEKAAGLQLPADLLARKRLLMALYNDILRLAQAEHREGDGELSLEEVRERISVPEELQGWRRPLVLDDVLEVLAS